MEACVGKTPAALTSMAMSTYFYASAHASDRLAARKIHFQCYGIEARFVHYVRYSLGVFYVFIADNNLHAIAHPACYSHPYLTCSCQYHHIFCHILLHSLRRKFTTALANLSFTYRLDICTFLLERIFCTMAKSLHDTITHSTDFGLINSQVFYDCIVHLR